MKEKVSPTVFLLALISSLLCIALLKEAQVIFLPFVVSILLSFALMPLIHWLSRFRVPIFFSSLISLAIAFSIVFLLGLVLSLSLKTMSVKLPFYIERIRELITWGAEKMRSFGIEADWGLLLKEIDPNVIAMWAGQSLLSVINLLTYGLVVFFITLFTLLESGHFKSKVIRAFGESNIFSDSSKQVAAEIQRYLLFKTLISFSTGFFVWAFLKIVGVDFPIIWGLLTFLLNFIPSIGSIVATIPPVLISLVQFENPLRQSLIVLLGLMAIQVTIGNYLDPKIMGRSLNLSALVIFMSLIFWGWMWGPVGMLLAVPLMVILKVALSHNPKTRPMAIMLEG